MTLQAGLVYAAVEAGRVDVRQHLRSLPELTPQQDQRLLQVAFNSSRTVRSIPMLEYLRGAGMALTHAACHRVVGDLKLVRWAREVRCSPSARALEYVMLSWPRDAPSHSRDLLEAVQLLVGEVGCAGWRAQQALHSENAVCAAAAQGDLALVQYLLQQLPGYQPGGMVLAAAAEGGCEALLEWLVEQHPGCLVGPWAATAYVAPAKLGDKGTLTALRRLGVAWGAEGVVAQAVGGGCCAQASRWLVEQGVPVGDGRRLEWAVTRAAKEGAFLAEEAAWLRGVAAAAVQSSWTSPT